MCISMYSRKYMCMYVCMHVCMYVCIAIFVPKDRLAKQLCFATYFFAVSFCKGY